MTKKSLITKAAGLAVAAGLALGTAIPAQAATIEELQALIAQLQAQIASLTGGTTNTGMSCNQVFTQNMTVGSTGTQVMDLQKVLNMSVDTQIATGASAGAPGYETSYFGPATRAAVIKFQNKYAADILAPVGLVSGTGYVGPSTRAKLNMVCSSTGGNTGNTGGNTGNTGSTTGTEGYMVVTLNASPSNGTNVEEGKTKDVASVKVEAFNSDMTINRVDINFNKRPWLYLSKMELVIDGDVVWSEDGLSSSNFIEVTEGSDYRLRVAGLSSVVTKGTKENVVLRVTAKSGTDKSTTAITATFQANSIRATDTKGLSHEEPNSALAGRSFDFETSTQGNVVATLNSNSPKERWVKVTDSGDTTGVELMRFDLEAEQQDINVNELRFTMATNGGINASALFTDVYLADESGNRIESASTIASTTVFTSLDDDYFDISEGSKKTFRLMVDVADADNTGVNAAVASTTLVANTTNIVAEDAEYDTATVGSVTLTSNDVHFNEVIANVSGQSASVTGLGNNDYLANVSFSFTLTADGGNVYVSKTPATFVATSTTASSASLTSISGGTAPGDSSTYYEITSGSSRTFTFSGSMNNLNGTAGTKKLEITGIYWDDDTSGLQEFSTDFELDSLEVNSTLTAA